MLAISAITINAKYNRANTCNFTVDKAKIMQTGTKYYKRYKLQYSRQLAKYLKRLEMLLPYRLAITPLGLKFF